MRYRANVSDLFFHTIRSGQTHCPTTTGCALQGAHIAFAASLGGRKDYAAA